MMYDGCNGRDGGRPPVPADAATVTDGPDALPDFVAATGAVRSADVDDCDFCSFPLLGLLAGIRVSGGGAAKYGRFNYLKGFPIHVTINHAVVHAIRWLLGDRSEPHLAKAMWGFALAAQTEILHPDQVAPHVLGPGATLSPELLAEMERGRPERDARRRAGEFEGLFRWAPADMPEAKEVLAARARVRDEGGRDAP